MQQSDKHSPLLLSPSSLSCPPSSTETNDDAITTAGAEAALHLLQLDAASDGDADRYERGQPEQTIKSGSVEPFLQLNGSEASSDVQNAPSLSRTSQSQSMPVPTTEDIDPPQHMHQSLQPGMTTVATAAMDTNPVYRLPAKAGPFVNGGGHGAVQLIRQIGQGSVLGSVAAAPRQYRPYQKKNPLFYNEHKARVRSTTGQKIKAMVSDLKTAFNRRFREPVHKVEEALQYRVRLARQLDDPRSDDQLQLQYLRNILRRSEAQQKQVLRPSRRALKEQERLEAERKQRERKLRGIFGRQPLPMRLDDEQEVKVVETLRRQGKIAQIPGAGVESHDIAKLGPGQWLNDEVINFYMKLIERRSNVAAQKRTEGAEAQQRLRANQYTGEGVDEDTALAVRKRDMQIVSDVKKRWNGVWNVHVFNSFFYEKLSKQGYSGVRQWTRKVDIFTKDRILVPINVGQMHWVCAAINMRQCRFEYFDSMHSPNPRVFTTLAAYLTAEYADKKKEEFGELDLRGWKRYFSRQSPAQSNGYDCGVFATMTIEQLSRRSPWDGPMPPALDARTVVTRSSELAAQHSAAGHLGISEASYDALEDDEDTANDDEDGDDGEELWNFSQRDMVYLRRRMVYEIVTTDLLD